MKEGKPLPKNRFEVFLDVFQMSWSTLVYISLFLGLFILPTILVVLFSQMANINILTSINSSNQEEILKATLEFYNHNIYTIFYMFPSLIVASFGFAGCFNIMKKLVWSERIEFFDCFKKGIKGNVGKIIFNAVILDFIYAIGVIVYLNVLFGELNLIAKVLLIGFSIVVCLFLINMLFNGYCQMAIYNNSLFEYIKNNFIFSFFSYFRSCIITLLALVFVIIGFLFDSIVSIVVVYSIYLLIGFGFATLLYTLNCHHLFDKLINKTNYPNIYRKGMIN